MISRPPKRAKTEASNGHEPEPPEQGSRRKIGRLTIRTADEAGGSVILAIAGKSGSGKTPLAGTLLDWKGRKQLPAFWIDVEGGMRSIRTRGADIESVAVTDWPEFLSVRGDLERGRASQYCGICLDNASELADLCMDATIEERPSTDPNRPNLLDWRVNSRTVVTQAVRKLRDIGRKYNIPIIINVWEREEHAGENGEGPVRAVNIDLNAKLRNLLLGACDLSLWLEVTDDGEHRIVHTAQSRRTDAKVRGDIASPADKSIPKYIYQPSLAPILDAMIGGVVWPEGLGTLPEGIRPRFVRAQLTTPTTPVGGKGGASDLIQERRRQREKAAAS